jgi:hypothetical protein
VPRQLEASAPMYAQTERLARKLEREGVEFGNGGIPFTVYSVISAYHTISANEPLSYHHEMLGVLCNAQIPASRPHMRPRKRSDVYAQTGHLARELLRERDRVW